MGVKGGLKILILVYLVSQNLNAGSAENISTVKSTNLSTTSDQSSTFNVVPISTSSPSSNQPSMPKQSVAKTFIPSQQVNFMLSPRNSKTDGSSFSVPSLNLAQSSIPLSLTQVNRPNGPAKQSAAFTDSQPVNLKLIPSQNQVISNGGESGTLNVVTGNFNIVKSTKQDAAPCINTATGISSASAMNSVSSAQNGLNTFMLSSLPQSSSNVQSPVQLTISSSNQNTIKTENPSAMNIVNGNFNVVGPLSSSSSNVNRPTEFVPANDFQATQNTVGLSIQPSLNCPEDNLKPSARLTASSSNPYVVNTDKPLTVNVLSPDFNIPTQNEACFNLGGNVNNAGTNSGYIDFLNSVSPPANSASNKHVNSNPIPSNTQGLNVVTTPTLNSFPVFIPNTISVNSDPLNLNVLPPNLVQNQLPTINYIPIPKPCLEFSSENSNLSPVSSQNNVNFIEPSAPYTRSVCQTTKSFSDLPSLAMEPKVPTINNAFPIQNIPLCSSEPSQEKHKLSRILMEKLKARNAQEKPETISLNTLNVGFNPTNKGLVEFSSNACTETAELCKSQSKGSKKVGRDFPSITPHTVNIISPFNPSSVSSISASNPSSCSQNVVSISQSNSPSANNIPINFPQDYAPVCNSQLNTPTGIKVLQANCVQDPCLTSLFSSNDALTQNSPSSSPCLCDFLTKTSPSNFEFAANSASAVFPNNLFNQGASCSTAPITLQQVLTSTRSDIPSLSGIDTCDKANPTFFPAGSKIISNPYSRSNVLTSQSSNINLKPIPITNTEKGIPSQIVVPVDCITSKINSPVLDSYNAWVPSLVESLLRKFDPQVLAQYLLNPQSRNNPSSSRTIDPKILIESLLQDSELSSLLKYLEDCNAIEPQFIQSILQDDQCDFSYLFNPQNSPLVIDNEPIVLDCLPKPPVSYNPYQFVKSSSVCLPSSAQLDYSTLSQEAPCSYLPIILPDCDSTYSSYNPKLNQLISSLSEIDIDDDSSSTEEFIKWIFLTELCSKGFNPLLALVLAAYL